MQVQCFLGLANFFRKFIRDFTVKVKPLHDLLRKSVLFNFNADCINAFESIKTELVSRPLLNLFNPTAEAQIQTNASSHGLGGILLQKQPSGNWSLIAYFSQATNKAEQNYHSFELEMLAIVRGTFSYLSIRNGIHGCNGLQRACICSK